MLRKLLYVFAFLGLLIWVVPLFVDLSSYANPYLADAQKTVGRSIKTGSIKLQILPTPRIKIKDVVLGNSSNSSNPDMLKVKSVEVILSLTNLLMGKIVVKSVDVNSPEVNLEKFKNGDANWNINVVQPEKEESVEKTTSTTTNAASAGLLVKHFRISDAVVHYTDHNNGSTKDFANLNIESTTEKLLGPYKVRIFCESGFDRLDLEILSGEISLNSKTALKANVSVLYDQQKIQGKLNGFLDITNKSLEASFNAISEGSPINVELANQKIDLNKGVEIKGEISASSTQVDVKDLSISHPVGSMVGLINYDIADSALNTELTFNHKKDSISIKCSTQNFEDFNYQVSSLHYQEILKLFGQEKIINGAIDIKGIFKTKDSLLILKKNLIQLNGASAEADVQFNSATKETAVQSRLKDIQSWGKVFGQDLPLSGGAAINLNITPGKEGSKISTKLALAEGKVAFDGVLGNGALIAKGILSVEQLRFNEMVVNLKSDIQVKSKEVNLGIRNINLKSKSGFDLAASGDILIDTSKEKPHIVGSITAQPIQLTSYQDEQVFVLNALYNPELFKYRLLQIANKNSRWSSEEIKLPLSLLNINLKIAVPKITLAGLVFEGLQSEIALVGGKLSVPFSARMYGGSLNGALKIADNEQKVNLSVNFDGVSIEKIAAAAAHFKQGKASGSMDLQTSGKSQYDFVSRLNGRAEFKVTDGIVKGFDLREIVGALKKPKNLLDLKILQNGFSGKGETAFSKAAGIFTVKNGVASTNDLTIETADAVMKIEGQADILEWQMRFNGEVVVQGVSDLPPLKFVIKGPIDSPSYSLDLKQLQQLFMKKGVGELVSKSIGKAIPGLDKIIPGMGKTSQKNEPDKAESSSNSNQQEKPKAVKPEKVVKDLMKGIFG
jgi:uncharacterized protein involved in outer membrane biogenesis